ncbi:MAG: MaoC family dehydratase N-terminal domain-containing protein [Acetobacteraceae bacterium]|nr:MaoC family dehydratase N-terminal domain-containing protein [Acetobacteraceae bacterium]
MAATLDREEVPETLPPLWHWVLFGAWVRPAALGQDGHPARGKFLPADPDLPRRMYAGGRLTFFGPLRAGDTATRRSVITRVEEKQGGSGRLLFVTVRHEISGRDGLALIEDHDIVYRGPAGGSPKPSARYADPPGAFQRTISPDPVLLFRYSALTCNGHRIHYDRKYVTEVEGYPGLIVHGPLQATLLAELAQRHAPARRLARFAFRAVRPVFDLEPFRLVGHWHGVSEAQLAVVDHAGRLCMRAEAAFE